MSRNAAIAGTLSRRRAAGFSAPSSPRFWMRRPVLHSPGSAPGPPPPGRSPGRPRSDAACVRGGLAAGGGVFFARLVSAAQRNAAEIPGNLRRPPVRPVRSAAEHKLIPADGDRPELRAPHLSGPGPAGPHRGLVHGGHAAPGNGFPQRAAHRLKKIDGPPGPAGQRAGVTPAAFIR